MKILLFGGSGCLGNELQKLNAEIICPTSKEVNICDVLKLCTYLHKISPDLIINAAAETDNRAVEKNPNNAIAVNVIGSANIAMFCVTNGVRLVYISTDYIYKGDHGNYKETDPIQPFNLYSWTKLGGECSTRAVQNHLIIRTSFGANCFPYSESFSDKWSSKDYVDVIAPLILEAAISPLTGILNLGTERKTLHAHASERSASVKAVKIADTNYHTPYDTSLNLQKWRDYKDAKSIAKPHCSCRVCGSSNLTKYLDLGLMPLANNLEFTAISAKEKEKFPLQVMFCNDCALSQLSVVIDPEKMFSYYTYRSSVNGGYVKHCRQMAIDLGYKYNLNEYSFHIDIAGNDGTLLKEFKEEIGLKVLNVDPATNLVAIAEAQGILSVAEFWSIELAEKLKGSADLITATNVFAHLDNVKEFIQAAKIALKPNGILVIENPYLVDTIDNMEFGQVYFEHVTYWCLTPLIRLCNDLDMIIIDCEKQDIHSGTMRYTIASSESDHEINKRVFYLAKEEVLSGFSDIEKYSNWANLSKNIISDFGSKLLDLKKKGKKIAGFAASAKGNTLLNCAGITTDIMDYIADHTPEKIGKFSPGTGIPIVNPQMIIKTNPDYIVILSWNFTQEIMGKVKSMGYAGKFIVPIPEFQIVG